MADLTDQERATVRKLADRLQYDATFTDDDLRVIREMVQVYRGVATVTKIGRALVVSLAAIAAAVTAWEVLAQKVRAWFGAP